MSGLKVEGHCERCKDYLPNSLCYDMLVHKYRWLCDSCTSLASPRRAASVDRMQTAILERERASRHSSRPDSTPANRLVLIVDDDDDTRETVSGVLEDEGFTTLKASNGKTAMDMLAACKMTGMPQLILLDLMMPVMDGWAFYEQLCLDASTPTIPVIVMTAHGSSADFVRELPLLRKPIHLDELLSAVNDACA